MAGNEPVEFGIAEDGKKQLGMTALQRFENEPRRDQRRRLPRKRAYVRSSSANALSIVG